jgi:hypothetical protein
MAAEDLNLRELKSWQDAFDRPLVTTRRIEQSLRADILSSRERLRNLVGYLSRNMTFVATDTNSAYRSSYRDLLSTAERIRSIDGQMREAEDSLADISRNCNSDVIDSKVLEATKLHRDLSGKSMTYFRRPMFVGG